MIRSDEYREYVRARPCCGCRSTVGVEFHHPDKKSTGGGMGLKGSDLRGVPLCTQCHEFTLHITGRLPGAPTREATQLVIAKAQAECLEGFLIRKFFAEAA